MKIFKLTLATLIFLAFILGGFLYEGNREISGVTEISTIDAIKKIENNHVLINNKFKYIPKTKYGDFTYEVHEHLKPDGSVGYVIYLYKTTAKGESVKSFSYNLDNSWSVDWTLLKPITTNASST